MPEVLAGRVIARLRRKEGVIVWNNQRGPKVPREVETGRSAELFDIVFSNLLGD